MIQAEWQREDKLTQPADYAAATARHLEKARTLIASSARVSDPAETADRRSPGNSETCGQPGGSVGRPATAGDAAVAELEQLAALAARTDTSLDEQRAIYLRTRWLKRQVLLSNPQMQFGQLLFAKRVPTSYSHLVMQYFGWRARPGGGLFVLENPGRSLAARDLLDGQLAGGNVLEPRLSYDAQRIIFSFSKCTPEDPFYHIYEVRTDGTGLRQLTDGEYEDLMPNYLPDGGIVFSSTRRKGHARCFGGQFGPRWHVYTLHRMDADGAEHPDLVLPRDQRVVPHRRAHRPHLVQPLGLRGPAPGPAPEPVGLPSRRHQSGRPVGQSHPDAALHVPAAADPEHDPDRVHRVRPSFDHRGLGGDRVAAPRQQRRTSADADHARGPVPRGGGAASTSTTTPLGRYRRIASSSATAPSP